MTGRTEPLCGPLDFDVRAYSFRSRHDRPHSIGPNTEPDEPCFRLSDTNSRAQSSTGRKLVHRNSRHPATSILWSSLAWSFRRINRLTIIEGRLVSQTHTSSAMVHSYRHLLRRSRLAQRRCHIAY
jgi:hypothetical protein